MNKTREIIELSGGEFAAIVLLGGVFSPLLFILSWVWEVIRKWL